MRVELLPRETLLGQLREFARAGAQHTQVESAGLAADPLRVKS